MNIPHRVIKAIIEMAMIEVEEETRTAVGRPKKMTAAEEETRTVIGRPLKMTATEEETQTVIGRPIKTGNKDRDVVDRLPTDHQDVGEERPTDHQDVGRDIKINHQDVGKDRSRGPQSVGKDEWIDHQAVGRDWRSDHESARQRRRKDPRKEIVPIGQNQTKETIGIDAGLSRGLRCEDETNPVLEEGNRPSIGRLPPNAGLSDFKYFAIPSLHAALREFALSFRAIGRCLFCQNQPTILPNYCPSLLYFLC